MFNNKKKENMSTKSVEATDPLPPVVLEIPQSAPAASEKEPTKKYTINTVQFDARFPNTNQNRHCFQAYVDYFRCIKVYTYIYIKILHLLTFILTHVFYRCLIFFYDYRQKAKMNRFADNSRPVTIVYVLLNL